MHLVGWPSSRQRADAREHTGVRELAGKCAKIAIARGTAQLSSDADGGETTAVVADVLDGTGEGGIAAQEHDERDGPAVARRRWDRLHRFAAGAIDEEMGDAQTLGVGGVLEIAPELIVERARFDRDLQVARDLAGGDVPDDQAAVKGSSKEGGDLLAVAREGDRLG